MDGGGVTVVGEAVPGGNNARRLLRTAGGQGDSTSVVFLGQEETAKVHTHQ